MNDKKQCANTNAIKEPDSIVSTVAVIAIILIAAGLIAVFQHNNNKNLDAEWETVSEYSTVDEAESLSVEVSELISESSSCREEARSIVKAADEEILTHIPTTKRRAQDETTEEPTTAVATEAYDEDDYEYQDGGHGDYIGHFRLTAYEWTGNRMKNEEWPYYGACACNRPELWGKYLYIEGLGTFKVCDIGGGLGNDTIDIYLGDPDVCNEFGVQYADVYYAYEA